MHAYKRHAYTKKAKKKKTIKKTCSVDMFFEDGNRQFS